MKEQVVSYEGGTPLSELTIPVGHWKASDYNQLVYVSGPEPRAVLEKAQEMGCDMGIISLDCVIGDDIPLSTCLLLDE